MSQHYSDPARASDPHALPNIEVFYVNEDEGEAWAEGPISRGWYWWACLPGCLPDSDPEGPFDSEEAALADAQDQFNND